MTKLFIKHFVKHVLGVAGIFATMSAFAFAGDYIFGHLLYGLIAFVAIILLAWMAERSWFDADKNVVIKNDNFSWWTEENVNLWCEVYNSYYEYDNRVVKVLKFDGKELHIEPLEGFDLRDESKLNALDVPSLIQIHREYVDIWSKMLDFVIHSFQRDGFGI